MGLIPANIIHEKVISIEDISEYRWRGREAVLWNCVREKRTSKVNTINANGRNSLERYKRFGLKTFKGDWRRDEVRK